MQLHPLRRKGGTMIDRLLAYNILYALVAKDGREAALFGNNAAAAAHAYTHSLATEAVPELWFELPLAGEPWFDFHALTSRQDTTPGMHFEAERCGGFPEVFEWFATQNDAQVRQLALSWDISAGKLDSPAIQLLVNNDAHTPEEFLAVAGRADMVEAYRAFVERIPEGWYACYTGVFPERPGHGARVECIPNTQLQQAYATDAALLEHDLLQAGVPNLGETTVSRCQTMAAAPFQFEFQFDIEADGSLGNTMGASSRFAFPSSTNEAEQTGHAAKEESALWECFDAQGAAGELMSTIESWGLADERWRLLEGTIVSSKLSHGENSVALYCYPTFVKLRWRNGEPLDAKAYLIAGVE